MFSFNLAAKKSGFSVDINSSPNEIVFPAYMEKMVNTFEKLPITAHAIGIMVIGGGLFFTGKHYFHKKDELKGFKDHLLSFGFMGIGAAILLFSPYIALYMQPKTISV